MDNFICQNKVFGCRFDNTLINKTFIGIIQKLMNNSGIVKTKIETLLNFKVGWGEE
jgi:hypothetical protein